MEYHDICLVIIIVLMAACWLFDRLGLMAAVKVEKLKRKQANNKHKKTEGQSAKALSDMINERNQLAFGKTDIALHNATVKEVRQYQDVMPYSHAGDQYVHYAACNVSVTIEVDMQPLPAGTLFGKNIILNLDK